jgi:hypothetical protein
MVVAYQFPQIEKKCSVCLVTKPVAEFYRHSQKKHLFHSECIACNKAAALARQKDNPRTKQKNKIHALKAYYGLTWAAYKEMMDSQGGKCAICRTDFDLSDEHGRVGKNKPCVDHCHETHKVRGILCGQCNRGLGFFSDNADVLQSAISYLDGGK